MNREDGFPIADIDVGLFHDPKVIALVRAVKDERCAMVHLGLYQSLVLASWGAGDRLVLDEALPAWWMGDVEPTRAALLAAKLIDAESRVPVASWESWYVPAYDRREKRRQSGAEGGRRSWQSRSDKRRRSTAEGTPNPSDRPADRPTDRPAGRTATPPNGQGAVGDVPPKLADRLLANGMDPAILKARVS